MHSSTKLFGILITLTVTTLRKVMSILLSFVLFPKPFVLGHALAIVLVFAGVFLRIYNTNKKSIDEVVMRNLIPCLRGSNSGAGSHLPS